MNMQAFANAERSYDNMPAPSICLNDESIAAATEDELCRYVALQWELDGGDKELFLASIEAIANRIEFGDEGENCIDYAAQYWGEGGGDADSFRKRAEDISDYMGW